VIDVVRPALIGQFEAALCMLNDCARKCPVDHWDGRIANDTFRQVIYHTVYFTDLYLSPGEAAFSPRDYHERGGDERSGTTPGAGLSKEETLAYIATCRQKAAETLAAETAESMQAGSGFSRLPFSRLELHVYNIRHMQHHAGQLSAYLRRIVEDGERWWVRSGWR
jgi:uncharacterized damage-inducible protein DinB